ncbi:MAG TPA: hypothetical protein VK921_11865 [Anditalea sp.]|nr:hypothetical protein [Anditalea sp.]
MKKLIYIMIAIMGAAFMTSCTGSATMVGGTVGYGYGYYDNVYFHGHPAMYRNNVVIVNNHTTQNNKTVGTRANRSATRVATNNSSRQATRGAAVQSRQQNTRNNNVATPNRSNVTRSAAPSPTRTSAPASRSTSRSARGGR